MSRNTLTVLLVDAALLVALFYVAGDLQWRVSYASSVHHACPTGCSYAPSFGYSVLTQFFTMAGNGASLTSPPTLDWVQLIALFLVLVNGWYAYLRFRPNMPRPAG